MQIICLYRVVVLCSLYYAPRDNRQPNLYDFIHEYNIMVIQIQHCRLFIVFISFFFKLLLINPRRHGLQFLFTYFTITILLYL